MEIKALLLLTEVGEFTVTMYGEYTHVVMSGQGYHVPLRARADKLDNVAGPIGRVLLLVSPIAQTIPPGVPGKREDEHDHTHWCFPNERQSRDSRCH